MVGEVKILKQNTNSEYNAYKRNESNEHNQNLANQQTNHNEEVKQALRAKCLTTKKYKKMTTESPT